MSYKVNEINNVLSRVKVTLLKGEIITKSDMILLTTNLAEYIRLLRKKFDIACLMVKGQNGRKFGLYYASKSVSETKLKSYLKNRKLKML